MTNQPKIFYTADLHFGHENVIKHCNRPFASVEDMERVLIDNWNSVVSDDDVVYIAGDFSYRSASSMKPILKALKGKKHLVLGNHDRKWFKNIDPQEFFESVSSLTEINDGKAHVTLCHYPMCSWHRSMRGAFLVHGHIHNNIHRDSAFIYLKDKKALNAGVDVNNFTPCTLDQLIDNKKKFYARHGLEVITKDDFVEGNDDE